MNNDIPKINEEKSYLCHILRRVLKAETPRIYSFEATRANCQFKSLLRASHNKPKYRAYKEAFQNLEDVARRIVKGYKVSDKQKQEALSFAFNIHQKFYGELIRH